jgi:hypothetical protein
MQQPLTKVLTLCCLYFFNLPYSTTKARQCMSPKLSLPLSPSTESRFCFQSFLCVSLSPGSVVIHLLHQWLRQFDDPKWWGSPNCLSHWCFLSMQVSQIDLH